MDRRADFIALAEKAGAMERILPILPLLDKEEFDGVRTGGFFCAPASTKYHGCYAGGLYDHSRAMYMELVRRTKKLGLTWTRPESPLDGTFAYNPQASRRHEDKSLDLIKDKIELTEEEELCIGFHMGLYTGNTIEEVKERRAAFSKAFAKYPTVGETHQADNWVAQVLNT